MKKQFLLLVFLCAADLYTYASFFKADTIKIGLLIPDFQCVAARHGAELAIDKANTINKGKYIFSLEVRSMEGAWGTGARQVVDLIFTKKVLALISAVDGRNAHLAEQISAKSQVIFMNAGSGDPTLSRAFVPWYFSNMPDDNQSASVLVEYLVKKDVQKASIVSDNGYDSRIAAEIMSKECLRKGIDSKIIYYAVNDPEAIKLVNLPEVPRLVESRQNPKNEFIIIVGKKDASLSISKRLHLNYPGKQVCIILSSQEEKFPTEQVLLASEGNIFYSGGLQQEGGFSSDFLSKYGYKPGPVAAYTFDAVNIFTITAVKAEADFNMIIENLSKDKFTGVTGEVRFDERGNPLNRGMMLLVSKGRFLPVQP